MMEFNRDILLQAQTNALSRGTDGKATFCEEISERSSCLFHVCWCIALGTTCTSCTLFFICEVSREAWIHRQTWVAHACDRNQVAFIHARACKREAINEVEGIGNRSMRSVVVRSLWFMRFGGGVIAVGGRYRVRSASNREKQECFRRKLARMEAKRYPGILRRDVEVWRWEGWESGVGEGLRGSPGGETVGGLLDKKRMGSSEERWKDSQARTSRSSSINADLNTFFFFLLGDEGG